MLILACETEFGHFISPPCSVLKICYQCYLSFAAGCRAVNGPLESFQDLFFFFAKQAGTNRRQGAGIAQNNGLQMG